MIKSYLAARSHFRKTEYSFTQLNARHLYRYIMCNYKFVNQHILILTSEDT